MGEDTPPPFIRFHTPGKPRDAYGHALAFAACAARVVENATARIQLRNRLDRLTTAIVIELARAEWELPGQRWRHARAARRSTTDAIAVLDLLVAQGAAPAADVDSARGAARALCDVLAPLGKLAS